MGVIFSRTDNDGVAWNLVNDYDLSYYTLPNTVHSNTPIQSNTTWSNTTWSNTSIVEACMIEGVKDKLFYWPTPALPNAATTVVYDESHTFTSPTVYMHYKNLHADFYRKSPTNDISGTTIYDTIIGYDPADVSSVVGIEFLYNPKNFFVKDLPLENLFVPMTFSDFNGCNNRTQYNPENVTITQNSSTSSETSSRFAKTRTITFSGQEFVIPFDPCRPYLNWPMTMWDIVPGWSRCQAYGIVDPPVALTPEVVLVTGSPRGGQRQHDEAPATTRANAFNPVPATPKPTGRLPQLVGNNDLPPHEAEPNEDAPSPTSMRGEEPGLPGQLPPPEHSARPELPDSNPQEIENEQGGVGDLEIDDGANTANPTATSQIGVGSTPDSNPDLSNTGHGSNSDISTGSTDSQGGSFSMEEGQGSQGDEEDHGDQLQPGNQEDQQDRDQGNQVEGFQGEQGDQEGSGDLAGQEDEEDQEGQEGPGRQEDQVYQGNQGDYEDQGGAANFQSIDLVTALVSTIGLEESQLFQNGGSLDILSTAATETYGMTGNGTSTQTGTQGSEVNATGDIALSNSAPYLPRLLADRVVLGILTVAIVELVW